MGFSLLSLFWGGGGANFKMLHLEMCTKGKHISVQENSAKGVLFCTYTVHIYF